MSDATTEHGSTTGITSPDSHPPAHPRVVIVGAGVAGLAAARALAAARSSLRVTVVDRHDFHTLTPLLYQVATGAAAPTAAARPVRSVLRGSGVELRVATVTAVNLTRRRVETDRGDIGYDYLILAAGSTNDYAAAPELAARSHGVADLGQALALRNHVLSCLEAASWVADPAERARLLSFVVAGGGVTGVEAVAALAGWVDDLTGGAFPAIRRRDCRVVLVEAQPAVLPALAADVGAAATDRLEARGVTVLTDARVRDADDRGITLGDGRRIEAATVVWAAGVRANPLADTLPAAGVGHRVIVTPSLQVERHPEVSVVGDMAEIHGRAGPTPLLASVAAASGRHAARSVLDQHAGRPPRPFHHRDGSVFVVLDRGEALGCAGGRSVTGTAGWLAWLGIDLAPGADRRAVVTAAAGWAGRRFVGRPAAMTVAPHPGPRQPPPPLLGPEPATAQVPMKRVKVDLPSVNVANANRWGRIAALAWWGQAYPGLQPEPDKPHGRRALRQREERLRQELIGDKSQTEDNYRG